MKQYATYFQKRVSEVFTEKDMNDLEEPEFIESEGFFKVIFWSKRDRKGLNTRQKQYLRMKDVGEITIKEYMSMFNVVRNTATKDLNELEDMNIVDKIKEGMQFIYRKTD